MPCSATTTCTCWRWPPASRSLSRSDTLDEILAAPDRDELVAWLRQRPLAMFVDAPPAGACGRAAAMGRGADDGAGRRSRGGAARRRLDRFPRPDVRQPAGPLGRRPEGIERLRCIVNALTRMRLCWPDGRMDFEHKESDKGPEGSELLPWFDLPGGARPM
jgi:bis(5'-nucleosyl)-tetraphosphatase (symmetrical)